MNKKLEITFGCAAFVSMFVLVSGIFHTGADWKSISLWVGAGGLGLSAAAMIAGNTIAWFSAAGEPQIRSPKSQARGSIVGIADPAPIFEETFELDDLAALRPVPSPASAEPRPVRLGNVKPHSVRTTDVKVKGKNEPSTAAVRVGVVVTGKRNWVTGIED